MGFNEEFIKKFKEKKFEINYIPTVFQIKNLKRKQKVVIYDNPSELMDYLENEKSFWRVHKEHAFFANYCNSYDNAISNLKNANNYMYSFEDYLKNVTRYIKDIPNSTTLLAVELLKYKHYTTEFYNGFIAGISANKTPVSNVSNEYMMGMYKGFQYIGIIKKIDEILPDEQEMFTETQTRFTVKANEYISKYDDLFKNKEQQFADMDIKIKEELDEQKKSYDAFMEEKDSRIKELEKLYNEKLRLESPAKYWDEMNVEYTDKAKGYIKIAIGLGLISIIVLVLIIALVPQATKAEHWFDLIKNTAILTIITSLLIYGIRVAVKMAMSSFHLARDAKERKQLTHFYLSLINEKAVTDKERELVITALFSRADTGLLKGDASPEMPSINISDIFNKKN